MEQQKISSAIIGRLKQDSELSDWWASTSNLKIPFFDNTELQINFIEFEPEKDKTFIEEADQALRNFLSLKTADRDKISDLAYKNCMDFLDLIEEDDDLRQIKDQNEIWDFVEPTEICVSRRSRRDEDIYIQVNCECDWEQEHGLQLVFRQGKKLTRISEQDGHLTEADAYDKPDAEDELLSLF